MMNLPIDWDSVPDVMNKDQFYRLCHISKSTALHLLKSGKVPCEWTGKKTRCYKIKKEDVRAYLEERAVYPELYSAPRGWYLDYVNAWGVVNGESNLDSFIMGFRLGANFAYEAFVSTETPFQDLLKE